MLTIATASIIIAIVPNSGTTWLPTISIFSAPFDDGSYFVLVDSEEAKFEQMGNTLHIEYSAGAEKIEIVGSHVVPEFGTIAMIVLAVAIVSIIVLTTKTRTTLIPKL